MYPVIKRMMDLVLATFAIILLSPLFLLIIIIIFLSGEKDVFYRQKRVGLGKQYFHMIKFTTMVKNSLNMGTGSITLRNDPRVTRVGKYLRMTKLNELPQLFNVLIGDMSIVGPRPLVDKTFNAYSADIQETVAKMKPGVTGLGSVVFRDEEKILSLQKEDPFVYYEKIIAPIKGAMEVWYFNHKSILVDIKLILLTGLSVIIPKLNAYRYFFKDLPMLTQLKEIHSK